MTVLVDAGLPNGTVIVLTGYQVETAMPPVIMPEMGVDLTVTVQSIRPVIVTKKDYPDPVLPGDSLIYTATVTNRSAQSLDQRSAAELYDPEPGPSSRRFRLPIPARSIAGRFRSCRSAAARSSSFR